MIQLTKQSLAVVAAADTGNSPRAGIQIRTDGTTVATNGKIVAVVTPFHQDELFQMVDGGELTEDVVIDREVIADLQKRLATVKKKSVNPYLYVAGDGVKVRAFSEMTSQSRDDTTEVCPKDDKPFPDVARIFPPAGEKPAHCMTVGLEILKRLVQLMQGVCGKAVDLEAFGSSETPNVFFRTGDGDQVCFGVFTTRTDATEPSALEGEMRDEAKRLNASAADAVGEVTGPIDVIKACGCGEDGCPDCNPGDIEF